MSNHDHTLAQVRLGEFDPPHLEDAQKMTAQEFAAKHRVPVEGTGVYLYRVTLDGCDYFWHPETGRFDGFGRSMRQEPDKEGNEK